MQEICLLILNSFIQVARSNPVVYGETCPKADTWCRASEHFFVLVVGTVYLSSA